MTRKEILTATPEWLNLKSLDGMGIELVETESDDDRIRLVDGVISGKRMAFRAAVTGNLCITDGGRWNPAEDIRDAFLLEEKVKEMGLESKYTKELSETMLKMDNSVKYMTGFALFRIAHATPEQRTKAFLLAMMEVE